MTAVALGTYFIEWIAEREKNNIHFLPGDVVVFEATNLVEMELAVDPWNFHLYSDGLWADLKTINLKAIRMQKRTAGWELVDRINCE